VERALDELNGVQTVDVDLVGKKVIVGFDESQVSESEIKNAIEDIGFDVE
jgi:copper chaperone CopZ